MYQDGGRMVATGCDRQHVGRRKHLGPIVSRQLPEPGLEREPGQEIRYIDLSYRRGPCRLGRKNAGCLERGRSLEPRDCGRSGVVGQPVHPGPRHVSPTRRRVCHGSRHFWRGPAHGIHLNF